MILFESFREIESLCKKYGITNYTIRPDGIVDVEDDVFLFGKNLTKLPLKFGKVSGSFDCSYNQLTTLEGAPKSVEGNFNCGDNQLTTLEGAPESVRGNFNCGDNQLTTLLGAPESVSGHFNCNNNQLTTLEGGPKSVGGGFYCHNNQLTTLEGGPKSVSGEFICNHNKLTTLEGGPYYRYLGGDMYCRNNPVYVLWQLFDYDYEKFMMSLDWDYIRGNKILRFKFVDALAEIDKTPPKSIVGYEYIG